MGDFNLSDLGDLEDYNYVDLWDGVSRTKAAFSWFCLGHNFDIVATILTMASLSWSKGFDAGLAIADITNGTDPRSAIDYARSIGFEPLPIRPDSGNRGSRNPDGMEWLCD